MYQLDDLTSDGRIFRILGPRSDKHFCPALLLRNGNSNLNLDLCVARPLLTGQNIPALCARAVSLKNVIMLTQTH